MKEPQIDFQKVIESVSSIYIILSTELNILYVNEALEKASMRRREDIIGRNLFEVFPDNPADKNADGVSNLSNSLHSVIKNKKQHTMAVQKYDIQRPDGTFEVRYWSPLNIPVLNSENEIEYIIHRVEDVTEFVLIKNEQKNKDNINIGLQKKVTDMEVEIIKRSREIQELNFELENKVKELESKLSPPAPQEPTEAEDRKSVV